MPDQWTCDECGASFQRREHHQRHVRTHTEEKPFACSVCGNSFGRIDSLARHHSTTHVHPNTRMASSGTGERQRVSRACKRCSTAKVRCDGKRPCEKCSQAAAECLYEPPKRRRNSHNSAPDPQSKRRSLSAPDPPQQDTRMPAVAPITIDAPPHFIDTVVPQACAMPIVDHAGAPDFMQLDFFSGPRAFGLSNDLHSVDWMSDSVDMGFWPAPFDLQQEIQFLQDIRRVDAASSQIHQEPPQNPIHQEPPQNPIHQEPPQNPIHQEPPQNPILHLPPTPASDIADLFSRSHSPVLDRDAVDVRQYHPTSIEVDAPLSFPEIDSLSLAQADMEDFAHVEALSLEKLDAMERLLDDVQTKPHYPLFSNPKLPPPSIINAWIQLYFEYFHPVFPILHKATFLSPETPPLLVLAVAAIGAQFSNLGSSLACARSLHELVRRLSSRECEFQNKHGRTVWMTQVVTLNSLGMSHSGDRRALEIAEILQAVPITLARRKGLLDDVLTHERISQLQMPLEQTWRLWAVDEERRRTGFGVWLVDTAFRSDFNLTTVLNSCELRNSLPQAETRWSANSAQSWASYPPGLGSGRTKPLAEVIASDSWLSVWSKTGTLGKHVILQELMNEVRLMDRSSQQNMVFPSDSAHAKDVLETILANLEQEQETPVNQLKALIAHKVICLAALMLCSSPAIDLLPIALSRIYDCLNDRELSAIAQKWREAPYQGREVVLHAARLFETIRNNHTTHYSMPSYLLRAVFTLWLYSLLFEKPEVTGFTIEQDMSGSIALATGDVDSTQVRAWLAHGCGRIKLPGMANLLCARGRCKLLEESIVAMGSLKSWGISKGYLQLLKRLEASEVAFKPS